MVFVVIANTPCDSIYSVHFCLCVRCGPFESALFCLHRTKLEAKHCERCVFSVYCSVFSVHYSTRLIQNFHNILNSQLFLIIIIIIARICRFHCITIQHGSRDDELRQSTTPRKIDNCQKTTPLTFFAFYPTALFALWWKISLR